MKDIESIAADVVHIALQLHRRIGPGLFESVYETLLATKLEEIGYCVARQVAIGIACGASSTTTPPYLLRAFA